MTTAIDNETTRATGVEGILANLNTTEKSNLVAALNELVANLATKSPLAGSASLTTYAGGTLGSAASKNMATGLSKTEVNPVPNNIVTQNIYGYLNTEVKKGSNDEFHNFKIAAGNVLVYNGTTLKVTFAKDCYCASSTAPSDTAKYPALSVDNGVTYHPIYVNQHGTPIPLPAHQIVSRTDADNISCNNYQWWWQAYTSFELMFVSSLGASGAWLIMGNPETVSYNSATESYKIKADGLIKQDYVYTPGAEVFIFDMKVLYLKTSKSVGTYNQDFSSAYTYNLVLYHQTINRIRGYSQGSKRISIMSSGY